MIVLFFDCKNKEFLFFLRFYLLQYVRDRLFLRRLCLVQSVRYVEDFQYSQVRLLLRHLNSRLLTGRS